MFTTGNDFALNAVIIQHSKFRSTLPLLCCRKWSNFILQSCTCF